MTTRSNMTDSAKNLNRMARDSRESSISVIGLGLMGIALVRSLLQKGYQVHVWNRSPSKTAALAAEGAVAANSPTQCIQASRLVIICVLDSDAVHVVLGSADPIACQNCTWINFTTGRPV